MNKDIFSAILAFTVLAGGTAAIGSEFLRGEPAPATVLASLPAVTVTGKRERPAVVATQTAAPGPTQLR